MNLICLFIISLHLDEDTGIITLINNNELDREKISEYRMSVEARDDNGHGNRNVTELIIKVLDSNGLLSI